MSLTLNKDMVTNFQLFFHNNEKRMLTVKRSKNLYLVLNNFKRVQFCSGYSRNRTNNDFTLCILKDIFVWTYHRLLHLEVAYEPAKKLNFESCLEILYVESQLLIALIIEKNPAFNDCTERIFYPSLTRSSIE